MRTLAKSTAMVLMLSGGAASAQFVSAEVTIAAPTIHFAAAPPLVVVSPGVQVVEGYDEEVFYTGGWYWCRRGDVWFRTHDYRGGWVVAPPRYVPRRIMRVPPGHYRNFYRSPGHGNRYRGGGYREVRRHEVHTTRAYPPGGRNYHEVRRHEVHTTRAYPPGGGGAMVVREHRGNGGGHRRGGRR